MSNPFILPMWLMCGAALVVSFLIDIPENTLWGLTAWLPWLVTLLAASWWNRSHR